MKGIIMKSHPSLLKNKIQLTSNSTPQAKSRHEKGKRVVTAERMKELKFLLMLSIIKTYKKSYLFRYQNRDIEPDRINLSIEEMTFQRFQQLQIVLEGKIMRYKSNVFSRKFTLFKPIVMNKQERFTTKTRNSSFIFSPNFQQNEIKLKYQGEIAFFQKLNVAIANLDTKNFIIKSKEYLSILYIITEKSKKLVYRNYKKITILHEKNPHSVSRFRQFCLPIFLLFHQLSNVIENVVQKDENYITFYRYFKQYQPKIELNDNLSLFFQALLFYYTSFVQMKRLYEISPRTQHVAQLRPNVIEKLNKKVIRLRHLMGYLNKQITNIISQVKQNLNQEFPLQIWRSLYEKKIMGAYRHRQNIRLQ